MTLADAITAAGMTPPGNITPGRWVRFPGIGKGRANRSGWCRLVTPTLAVFGDWSSNFSSTWKDDAHRDDVQSARLLAQARKREREFQAEQRARQSVAASKAASMIAQASVETHWYLALKGFPDTVGLVHDGQLLVPVRDAAEYGRVISVQQIGKGNEKRFLPGSRTRGGIYRLGSNMPRMTWLCEGYATGLSIEAALKRLPGPHAVIVTFSANNLDVVAERFPEAVVCADHDESKTGEEAAINTGLRWTMPPEVGDFNDMHSRHGLHAVTEVLRMLQ